MQRMGFEQDAEKADDTIHSAEMGLGDLTLWCEIDEDEVKVVDFKLQLCTCSINFLRGGKALVGYIRKNVSYLR